MASIGQIIFWSMIVLIFVFAGLIILLLAIAFSASKGSVTSNSYFPVGNLGHDVLLDCSFQTTTAISSSKSVSITWKKTGLAGVVYQYSNNAAQLQDQNSEFKNRVSLFPDLISSGNASILLNTVKLEDAGEYLCSVSAPGLLETISIFLRVGAFSAPNITRFASGLTAVAQNWLPKPDVTWLNQAEVVLKSNTTLSNLTGTFEVVSHLQENVTDQVYICIIQNFLVTGRTEAEVTGTSISTETQFIFHNSSPRFITSLLLSPVLSLICMLTW